MPPLPLIWGDEFVEAMGRLGYQWERTVGSHMILVHANGITLSVPRHKELGRGLLRRLLRDAGITTQEFLGLLK